MFQINSGECREMPACDCVVALDLLPVKSLNHPPQGEE
jgi:hypothetical protein